ncbi:hypothetical protein GQ53DRAFT_310445 [Thozetella sp. PMI_491]|nr:hypothetical protein GQ53DRAFT_310445 [Thozetella sp. PMI_491]
MHRRSVLALLCDAAQLCQSSCLLSLSMAGCWLAGPFPPSPVPNPSPPQCANRVYAQGTLHLLAMAACTPYLRTPVYTYSATYSGPKRGCRLRLKSPYPHAMRACPTAPETQTLISHTPYVSPPSSCVGHFGDVLHIPFLCLSPPPQAAAS